MIEMIWTFEYTHTHTHTHTQLNRDSPKLRDRGGVGLPKVGSTYVFNLICITLNNKKM